MLLSSNFLLTDTQKWKQIARRMHSQRYMSVSLTGSLVFREERRCVTGRNPASAKCKVRMADTCMYCLAFMCSPSLLQVMYKTFKQSRLARHKVETMFVKTTIFSKPVRYASHFMLLSIFYKAMHCFKILLDVEQRRLCLKNMTGWKIICF